MLNVSISSFNNPDKAKRGQGGTGDKQDEQVPHLGRVHEIPVKGLNMRARLYFKGEYIALTFSTFHALEDILKETVGRAIPSAELREGKSASQEDTVIDTVKELREFLEEL